jgi:hypothetical protein
MVKIKFLKIISFFTGLENLVVYNPRVETGNCIVLLKLGRADSFCGCGIVFLVVQTERRLISGTSELKGNITLFVPE